MDLGAFSISLAVKDLAASKSFYEKLGFEVCGGDEAQNWLILKSGQKVIGLFQGMFEGNILTFNPGWDQDTNELAEFNDVREIQDHLEVEGISLDSQVDKSSSGPASIMLKDPDGNQMFSNEPRHDWASHPADSFRTGAMGSKPDRPPGADETLTRPMAIV